MSKRYNFFGSTASLVNDYSLQLDGVNERATFGTTASHKFLHGAIAPATFQWTIAFWLKFDILPSSVNAEYGILSTGSGSTAGVGIDIFYSDAFGGNRSIMLLIANASGSIAGSVQFTNATTIVPDDLNWHQYILAYDIAPATSNLTLYVDGVLYGDSNKNAQPPSAANSSNVPTLGALGGGIIPFKGKMFYPVVLTTKLTALQALELFNLQRGSVLTTTFSASNLNAYYFPNGQADFPTWTDLIGNNNATMINGEAVDINIDVP